MSRYIDPASKLLGHMDRIVAIQRGEHPAPVNVEIDLSNRCNLGCNDCHFGHVHSRGPLARRRAHDTGDEFEYPLISEVLRNLEGAGVRSVTWTGGGEPTLHRMFESVVEDCPLPQGIYTNGTQIGEQMGDLLRRRCEWVYVSMDCCTRESYRQYKRTDAFEAACQGVRNLAGTTGRATVGVGYLIGAQNWTQLYEMAAHGLGLGAGYVHFRPMIDFDPARPEEAVASRTWIEQALPILYEVGRMPNVIVDAERFRQYQGWKTHNYAVCQWAQMQTVITPDARVWTCVNRRGFAGDALGDLHTETFDRIWARSRAYPVNCQCRVMCRGHVPNLALVEMGRSREHGAFI